MLPLLRKFCAGHPRSTLLHYRYFVALTHTLSPSLCLLGGGYLWRRPAPISSAAGFHCLCALVAGYGAGRPSPPSIGPHHRASLSVCLANMISFLSGLFAWLMRKDELKILIVGLDFGGKTTTLEQIKRAFLPQYRGAALDGLPPTIGMNLAKISTQGVDVTFWDVGGAVGAWSAGSTPHLPLGAHGSWRSRSPPLRPPV